MSKGDYCTNRGASASRSLAVIYRAIDQIKPDPANQRRHTRKQIRQIANSITVLASMFRS